MELFLVVNRALPLWRIPRLLVYESVADQAAECEKFYASPKEARFLVHQYEVLRLQRAAPLCLHPASFSSKIELELCAASANSLENERG